MKVILLVYTSLYTVHKQQGLLDWLLGLEGGGKKKGSG